jgi:hypothetical protein
MTEDWLKYIARNKLNGLGGLKQQTAKWRMLSVLKNGLK